MKTGNVSKIFHIVMEMRTGERELILALVKQLSSACSGRYAVNSVWNGMSFNHYERYYIQFSFTLLKTKKSAQFDPFDAMFYTESTFSLGVLGNAPKVPDESCCPQPFFSLELLT